MMNTPGEPAPATPPSAGSSTGSAKVSRVRQREGRAGYLFITPTTVLLSIFYLWPLLLTIIYSFTDWNPASGKIGEFQGLGNFAKLLSSDDFRQAAGNTVLFVLVIVPANLGLGLILASLLAQPFRGRAAYRALLFVPYIAPMVGSALIFTYILSPLGGIVNGVMGALGMPPIAFLSQEPWSMISVMAFTIWHGVGYTMIIYSAALSNIPPSYYEAARLDGAGPLRQFLLISVPLVRPTTAFLMITGIIGVLQIFTQVYVLTRGGPLGSSKTLLFYIYENGFVFFNGGLASAAAVFLLVVGITASIVQLKLRARKQAVEIL